MYTRDNQCFLTFSTRTGLREHLRDRHFNHRRCQADTGAVEKFLTEHLNYQDRLRESMTGNNNKSLPDSAKSLYRGCPACDRIIAVYDIIIAPEPDPSLDNNNNNNPDPNPSSSDPTYDFDILDIDQYFSGNNVNHINPHIKYYPYECRRCHESLANNTNNNNVGNNGSVPTIVKTATKATIRRHIINRHLLTERLERSQLEREVNRCTLTYRVSVLDRLSAN